MRTIRFTQIYRRENRFIARALVFIRIFRIVSFPQICAARSKSLDNFAMWYAKFTIATQNRVGRHVGDRCLFLSPFLFNGEILSVSDHVTIARHFTIHKVSFEVESEWDSAFDRIQDDLGASYFSLLCISTISLGSQLVSNHSWTIISRCDTNLRDSEFTKFSELKHYKLIIRQLQNKILFLGRGD